MFKKSLSLGLTVLTLFTFALPVSAAQVEYTDVSSDDWYYGSLGSMSDNKIIAGYPDGSFRASDTLQVDQFLAMLCRLTDNDVGLGDSYWAQNYIDYADDQGWLDGLTFSSFDKPINRFETARLTVRALGLTEETYPLEYPDYEIYVGDYSSVPSKYRTDVLVNYALGITRGYPDGTFQGYNTLTRAEGAVISHRIFDDSVRKPPLVPSKTQALMMIMPAAPAAIAPLEEEMTLENAMMMFFASGGGGGGSAPAASTPVALPDTALEPEVAVISENVLADAIIEITDDETTNQLAAGYNYGIFNINLLSEENDSLLIYTAEEGHNVITIDLLNLANDDGSLDEDAVDFIRLICMNIDEAYGEDMTTWIVDQYKNRDDIPVQGNDTIIDDNLMGISSLIHDHNVLKVTIQTGVDEDALDDSTDDGGGFN